MKKREFLLCFILISIFTVFFIPSSFLASNREIIEFGSFPQEPDYIQEIVDQFDKQPGVKVIDGTKYLYEDGRLYPFEPIRWIVLSESGDNALLLSEKVLFTSGWNNDGWFEQPMWSDGRVRNLLNNWFYNMAFDNAEKDCIHTSTNKTILRTSADGGTYDVETTEDNVFILSMAELPDAKEDCIAYPTKYIYKKVYNNDSKEPYTYFARDIAEYLLMQGPVYVNKEGATYKDVSNANHGVRPAIRVNLSKLRAVNADKEKAKIKSLSNAIIKLQKTSYKYDGKVKRPEVTVLYEGKELSPSDYTVDYLNNKYAGTAVVKVTGTGRFSDTVKTTFTIKPGKKVTISFNGNGGKASKKSIKVKAGSKYGTLPSAKWKGYKFLGWFTKKKGGEQVSDTSNLEKAKNQTLYAQWEKEVYLITYELNGGTNSQKNPTSYSVSTKTFSFKNPTRNGYVFKGWYTDSKFKKSIKKIAKGSAGDKTIYAKWTPIKYTIKFLANGATGKMSNISAKYDKEYKLPTNSFKKKGYTFSHWEVVDSKGTQCIGNSATVKNLTNKDGKTVTLTANWEKIPTKTIYGCVIAGSNSNEGSTVQEATDFYSKLLNNRLSGYSTEAKNIKKYSVSASTSAPSIAQINQWIAASFANTSDDDISYVCYFGHGVCDADVLNETGAEIGLGLYVSDKTSGKVYSYASFINMLTNNIKGRIVLITGACYSGGFVDCVKNSPEKSRINVFTSSDVTQPSVGDFKGTIKIKEKDYIGAFLEYMNPFNQSYMLYSYIAIDGLSKSSGYSKMDTNKDGKITGEEYGIYVNTRIKTFNDDFNAPYYLGFTDAPVFQW